MRGLQRLHDEREAGRGGLLLEPEPALERAPRAQHHDGAPGRVPEPPAVQVPQDVDGRAVDEDRLVAPEVPAQAARVHGALPVDADPELLAASGGGGAADADLVLRRAVREADPRGVHRVGRRHDAVRARDGEEARLGDPALELGLDELGRQVADGEDDLGVGDGDEVEPGERLGGRSAILCGGEVPEERERGVLLVVGGQGAGAFAAAEEDGAGGGGGSGEGECRGPDRGVGPGEAEEERRRRRGERGGVAGDGDGEGGRRGGGRDERGGRSGAGDADGAVGDAGGEVPHGGGEQKAGRAHHWGGGVGSPPDLLRGRGGQCVRLAGVGGEELAERGVGGYE